MKDDEIDKLLTDWSNTKTPEPEKRVEILRNISDFKELQISSFCPKRRISIRALISGGSAVAILLVFAVLADRYASTTVETVDRSFNSSVPASRKPAEIRFSLLILERSGDEAFVEILEDTVLTAEDQNVYERSIDGHKLFFWFLALEPSVFSLDVGIDDVAETGIVAVPDKTKAVHLTADGRQFDVFVSIM